MTTKAISKLQSAAPALFETLVSAIEQGAEIVDVEVTVRVKQFDGSSKTATIAKQGVVIWGTSASLSNALPSKFTWGKAE